jgi:hypothetical protein
MGQECLPVHEKRDGVWKEPAQLIENGKAVGIDISPIVDFLLLQPGSGSEIVKTVSRPENHHRIGNIRESQKNERRYIRAPDPARHGAAR